VYATPEDVRSVLSPDGQQGDYETAAGFSDGAVNDALSRAVAKIHAYLGERYALPVAVENDPDGLLRDWTSVIAAYFATLTYSRGQDVGSDDPIRLRYNDVLKVLERVQSGNLILAWPKETDNPNDDIAIVNRYDGSNLFQPDDFDLGDSRRPYGWGQLPGWGF
jgi:phage gp36-like protein